MESNKLTILAVDDNTISLATIAQELKGSYAIVPLNSGVRALQYLKQKAAPDLILLDIQMVPKNGIETLREIREMEKCQRIPVIMLTSQSEKQTIVESSKLGIKTQDLHDRIERVLKEEIDKRLENR